MVGPGKEATFEFRVSLMDLSDWFVFGFSLMYSSLLARPTFCTSSSCAPFGSPGMLSRMSNGVTSASSRGRAAYCACGAGRDPQRLGGGHGADAGAGATAVAELLSEEELLVVVSLSRTPLVSSVDMNTPA